MMRIAFGKIVIEEKLLSKKQYCCSYSSRRGLKIIKVIKGRIIVNKTFRLEEEKTLKSGDIVFVNVDQYIEKESIESESLLFSIDIDYKWALGAGYDLEKVYFVYYMLINSNEYRKRKRYLSEMIDIVYRRYLSKKSIVPEDILNIIDYLAEYFDFIKYGIDYKKMSDKIVDRYRNIFWNTTSIDGKYYYKNFKYISEDIGENYSYLRKDLKKRYGSSFSKLKKERMVRIAARLMVDSDLGLSEIAHIVGFSDHKYFIKHFKEVFKCKPSQYRKMVYNNCRYRPNNDTEE